MYEIQTANKEMNKLIRLLAEKHIPFEVRVVNIGEWPSLQICYPSCAECEIDAVSHSYSYGGKDGLIEILSKHEIDVVGWLTAEEAEKYFEVF